MSSLDPNELDDPFLCLSVCLSVSLCLPGACLLFVAYFKGAVSDLHGALWVSKSLSSAVNRKCISRILSSDWTRVSVGYQQMSSLYTAEWRSHVTDRTLCISYACLNVELFNTYFKFWLAKKVKTTHGRPLKLFLKLAHKRII